MRFLAIFLISAAMLAAELVLMRLYSLILWSHFAALVISMAMLGFGAAGTILAIAAQRLTARHGIPSLSPQSSALSPLFDRWFLAAGLCAGISLVACPALGSHLHTDPLFLLWDPGVLLVLTQQYILNALPFFCGALCLGLGFMAMPARIPAVYAANLAGSAAGALGILPLLELYDPGRLLVICALLVVVATDCWAAAVGRGRGAALFSFPLLLVLLYQWLVPGNWVLSPYKGLSNALLLPQAHIAVQRHGAMGRLDVVSSPALRLAPGLSLAYTGPLPAQDVLFFDGDAPSAITYFRRQQDLRFTDYLTSALPYHLLRPRRALIVGIGGGMDILAARYHQVPVLDAVEADSRIPELLSERYSTQLVSAAPNPLAAPGVQVRLAEARTFLERSLETYDLVQIALTEGFAATGSGVQALHESYLYTVEGMTAALRRLSPGGYLAITRWQSLPERDSLRLVATVTEALTGLDIAHPDRHLAVIRGWATVTILVKRTPLTVHEVQQIQAFCRSRLFDTVYFPGIQPQETNQYNKLIPPLDRQAIESLLSGGREAFLRSYAFDIRPLTDDRPYFHHFLRLASLPYLWRATGRQGLNLILEWGSLFQVVGLLQAVAASAVLLLLPSLGVGDWQYFPTGGPWRPGTFLWRKPLVTGDRVASVPNAFLVLYFLCLGFGFIFLELSFLQRFLLFLSSPLYAASIVIATFLAGAGLGSWYADRQTARAVPGNNACRRDPGPDLRSPGLLFGGIALGVVLQGFLIPLVFPLLFNYPLAVRAGVVVMCILPLAFGMGLPFPLGLRSLAGSRADLIPWAWAINGCASVIGALLTPLLALAVGFRWVMAIAIAFYLAAGVAYPRAGERLWGDVNKP